MLSETYMHARTQTDRTYIEKDRTHRQTDRTHRQTEHTDRQTEHTHMTEHTDRQTDKKTDRQTLACKRSDLEEVR